MLRVSWLLALLVAWLVPSVGRAEAGLPPACQDAQLVKIYAGHGECSDAKYIVVNLTHSSDYWDSCTDYLVLTGTDHCDRELPTWTYLDSIPSDLGADGGTQTISIGTPAADALFGVDLVVYDLPFDAWGGTLSTGYHTVSLGTVDKEYTIHLDVAEAGHAWVLVGDTWQQTNALAPDGSVVSLNCAAPPVRALSRDAGPSPNPVEPADAGTLPPAPACSTPTPPPPDPDSGTTPVGLSGVVSVDASVLINDPTEPPDTARGDASVTAANVDTSANPTSRARDLETTADCSCSMPGFGATSRTGIPLAIALALLCGVRRMRRREIAGGQRQRVIRLPTRQRLQRSPS